MKKSLEIVGLVILCTFLFAPQETLAQRLGPRGGGNPALGGGPGHRAALMEERLQRRLANPEQAERLNSATSEERRNPRINPETGERLTFAERVRMQREKEREARLERERAEGLNEEIAPPTSPRPELRRNPGTRPDARPPVFVRRNPDVPTPLSPLVRPDQQYSSAVPATTVRTQPSERVRPNETPIRDMSSEEITNLFDEE